MRRRMLVEDRDSIGDQPAAAPITLSLAARTISKAEAAPEPAAA